MPCVVRRRWIYSVCRALRCVWKLSAGSNDLNGQSCRGDYPAIHLPTGSAGEQTDARRDGYFDSVSAVTAGQPSTRDVLYKTVVTATWMIARRSAPPSLLTDTGTTLARYGELRASGLDSHKLPLRSANC